MVQPPPPPRCHSALGDKRRDAILLHISQMVAVRVSRSLQRSLVTDEYSELHRRIALLYHAHDVGAATAARPASALQGTGASKSGSNMYTTSNPLGPVKQSEMLDLQREFLRWARDRTKSSSDRITAPTSYAGLPPPSGFTPSSCPVPTTQQDGDGRYRLLTEEAPARPPISAASTPIDHQRPSSTLSPACLLDHHHSPVSSLRSATDAVISRMGATTQPPGSKRLRRMIRDAQEFEYVRELARAEQEEQLLKKKRAQEQRVAYRAALDSQCQQKWERQIAGKQSSSALRQSLEAAAAQAEAEERAKATSQRSKLQLQLLVNERTRLEREAAVDLQRLVEQREAAVEYTSFCTAQMDEREAAAHRKAETAAALAKRMAELNSAHQREHQQRREELKRAPLVLAQQAEEVSQQYEKREQYKEAIAQRVQSRLAQTSFSTLYLEREPSRDSRKDEWLAKKFARESAELAQRLHAANERERRKKEQSAQELTRTLRSQMRRTQQQLLQEKVDDVKWLVKADEDNSDQIARDALRRELDRQEKKEWVSLLGAQRQLKLFKETQDIETSIARAAGTAASSTMGSRAGSIPPPFSPNRSTTASDLTL